MNSFLFVGLGGIAGAISRYNISKWADYRWPGWFPTGTFTVNVLGSFLLGLLVGFNLMGHPLLDNHYLFLGTGFMGSFTTFSTFSVEVVGLLKREKFLLALRYPLFTLLAGISAAALGIAASSYLVS